MKFDFSTLLTFVIILLARCLDALEDGDLRLTGGTALSSGLVEIYHNGTWGSICGNYWTFPHAYVVCRQLGFTGGRGHRNAWYGESGGPIWTSSLDCTGLEANIRSCASRELDWWTPETSCTHSRDAGVECDVSNDGSIRLADGNSHSGNVEIFYNFTWFSICAQGWSDTDAYVVCRQLGMSPGTRWTSPASSKNGTTPLLTDVDCTGNEQRLSECNLPLVTAGSRCGSDELAAVLCTEPNEGAIRLVNGGQDHGAGRVEVFHSGSFGTICDDSWSDSVARVVCRQLGLTGGTAHLNSFHGQGDGHIWLKDVTCTGEESSLSDCAGGELYSSHINSCFHYEDASVTCQVPSAGSVRLSSNTTGLLQIYRHLQWGAICSENFDIIDSSVVCRQLGFYGGSVIPSSHPILTGVLIWGTSVNCDGSEVSLSNCPGGWTDNYLGLNLTECSTGTYAAVTCSENEPTTTEQFIISSDRSDCDNSENCDTGTTSAAGDSVYENSSTSGITEPFSVNPQLKFVLERAPMRLIGSEPYTGVVELYVDNFWSNICDSYWNDNDATVVCRQLGFTGGNAMGHLAASSGGEPYVRGVECDGDEAHLSECELHSSHTCSGAAAVSCTHSTQGVAGALRIVGGMFGSGQVEIFLSGRWGSICAGGHWDVHAARVVCRELGFTNGIATATKLEDIPDSTDYQISQPILTSINCSGSERRLYECREAAYVTDPASLPPAPLAGVQCALPKEGDLRLSGGTGGMSGRVEMYHMNRWGSVCSRGFDGQAALVVCKHLGFVDGQARYASHYGTGAGPVHVTHVSCLGSEARLLECHLSYAEQSLNLRHCTHSTDIGVQCTDKYMDDKKDNSILGALVACVVVLLFALMVVLFCVYTKWKSYKKLNLQIVPNEGTEKESQIPPSYGTVALESVRDPTETIVEPFELSSPMLTPRTLETLKVTPPPDTTTIDPPPPPTYRDLYPKRANTVM